MVSNPSTSDPCPTRAAAYRKPGNASSNAGLTASSYRARESSSPGRKPPFVTRTPYLQPSSIRTEVPRSQRGPVALQIARAEEDEDQPPVAARGLSRRP